MEHGRIQSMRSKYLKFQNRSRSVYGLVVVKGEKDWSLVFDLNGKLLEKKAIEEDDED
jgi:hypothetical protein